MNLPLLISLFVIVAVIVTLILWKTKEIKLYNIIIYLVLFSLWTAMYIFKNDGANSNDFSPWIWPIIACLYQFFQVLFRVPFGILSQKLNSRKQIVLIAGLVNLIGMTIVIATNFSLASIVIASACAGVYGSTFGLDSQYWSENHNIKGVFLSSAIVFTVPVLGSLLSNIIHAATSPEIGNSRMIVLLVAVGISAFTLIGYTFFKEKVETIRMDNTNEGSKLWAHKSYKDIFALSVAGAGSAFAFNFVFVVTKDVLGIYGPLILTLSLLASIITALFIIKKVKFIYVRVVSLSFLVISSSILGIIGIANEQSQAIVIAMDIIASMSFGVYIISLFGAALHFDHKFPALVLGIWLTFRSFAYSMSTLVGGEIKQAISKTGENEQMWTGIAIILAVAVGIAIIELASFYLFRKNKNGEIHSINEFIDNSVIYENNSNKVVNSKKKVTK